ncbi:hypothetical protein [Sinorhizobium meliloti]|uniref:hypothetical protein n=1 Tax=Rhizobium meliloti TaxID=382 RepID=UPI001E4B3687|nr:hypothetical protein [Sinorhizobium meliloti]UFX13030.1 hypothetical protein SmelRRI128_33340 [Sinorhizobium meliloti]
MALVIEGRRIMYRIHCQADDVKLSFAYMTEKDACDAVSERDISNVICTVSDVSPAALPANTFDAGFNWFIAYPCISSTPIDVVAWGKAIRA